MPNPPPAAEPSITIRLRGRAPAWRGELPGRRTFCWRIGQSQSRRLQKNASAVRPRSRSPMADLFARSATDIAREAIEKFKPVAIYAGFSGGNNSLALAHWMMAHVPGCELFHIDTGIGVQQTREFVQETAERYGWPLTIIRALEDCGSDYDWLVRRFGFPGPYHHRIMYRWLKERGVDLLVRRAKTKRNDRVMLATGVREDESLIRMGYKGGEVTRVGAKVWANVIYWWSRAERDDYLMHHQIPRNPVSKALGISGECLCGAYAHPGELERVRAIDPAVAARIDALHEETKDQFPWGWEGRPPRKAGGKRAAVGPMCIGCEKSVIVQDEMALL